jgi:enolase
MNTAFPSWIPVQRVDAQERLDSRGRPTLAVTVTLSDGTTARAGVPSGASTGAAEAVELRDGDPARYGGAGVLTAVANATGALAEAITGRQFADLQEMDLILRELDGTHTLSRLGGNAIVGVSMAVARAQAQAAGLPLWRVLSSDGVEARLPVPHFNVINGGAHAANDLDFQEFMIAPLGAASLPDAIRAGAEVYAALKSLLHSRGLATGLGDEGGFAPDLNQPEQALTLLVKAIEDAGYEPGLTGVAIALDPAANGFYHHGHYQIAGRDLTSTELIERYAELIDRFPIWSIEDGLAEDDREGWLELTEALGHKIQLVGDDIFVTDPSKIDDAARYGIANAALIKVNQIGTVSQTLAALEVCRHRGYAAMISHRSGETIDSFIADLAVGSGCGQLKSGAPARGERVAKYNRLLDIAADQPELPFGLATKGRSPIVREAT